jgi:hypothetical protein
MPIEHLKRLQKHFDLCILRAPEHEESEWFRRWRNCVGHMIDFPGMSLSAAWDASNPARYKAPVADREAERRLPAVAQPTIP